jgi:capsid portal protein
MRSASSLAADPDDKQDQREGRRDNRADDGERLHRRTAQRVERGRLVPRSRCIAFDLVAASLDLTSLVDRATFKMAMQDYTVFGSDNLEPVRSALGNTPSLRHTTTRRPLGEGYYYWGVPSAQGATPLASGLAHPPLPYVNQALSGGPVCLSALQAALLNKAATLFRRRYHPNGGQAGCISYATGDIAVKCTDAIKAVRGPGNVGSIFMRVPNIKGHSIKTIAIAEVSAKN